MRSTGTFEGAIPMTILSVHIIPSSTLLRSINTFEGAILISNITASNNNTESSTVTFEGAILQVRSLLRVRYQFQYSGYCGTDTFEGAIPDSKNTATVTIILRVVRTLLRVRYYRYGHF